MSHPFRRAALAAAASLAAAGSPAAVLEQSLSFRSADQSLWSSGGAFQFDWQRFVGLQADPGAWVYNPAAVSGSYDMPFPIPDFDYTANPYFEFNSAFRLGVDLGARLGGGAVDAQLDWGVAIDAPERIVRGQAFSLAGSATRLGSSGFGTQAPTAMAWFDGILDMYLGGYVRITTGEDLGSHDYRMGNKGFTDNNTSNNPYRTLADVNLSPEIASFNRDGNGQLRVAGQTIGGVGSAYQVGATTITAGDWRVAPAGSLQGATLRGQDQTTLLTATLDVDQMALLGSPALGTGFAHDWGVIDIDMGYEIVDLKASLGMGLKQDLALDSTLNVRLDFSEAVLVDGAPATSWTGSLDALPALTLLGDAVTVTPTFGVDAELHNQTALTFSAGAGLTLLEAHAYLGYDVSFFGVGVDGTVVDANLGPFYSWNTTIPLGDIGIYDQRFALQGFQAVAGQAFVLSAVPEPGSGLLWLAGLGAIGIFRQRRAVR